MILEAEGTDPEQPLFLLAFESGMLRSSSSCAGLRALEIIRESPPDLVVLNLPRAQCEGSEVLDSLRSDPFTALVPVIALHSLGPLELGSGDEGIERCWRVPFRLYEEMWALTRVPSFEVLPEPSVPGDVSRLAIRAG